MSSQVQIQNKLRPKKAGGNTFIYVILIVVGIVFAALTITALVIAIKERPRQLYLKNKPIPNKEVFVVVFDENSVSAHKSTGNDVGISPPPSGGTGPGTIIPGTEGLGTTTFIYPSGDDITDLQNLIISSSDLEPFNAITSQIGKSLVIASKDNVTDAMNKGAVFKYLKDETKELDSGNYVDLPFLISESFDPQYTDLQSKNAFFYIDTTDPLKPSLKTSLKPDGSGTGKTRLSIAFYGVKPTFGDFVTRQYSTVKHVNNPTAIYLKTDASDFLPSATFKAPWLGSDDNKDAIYVFNFRIVPFNSIKFNNFVNFESAKYEADDADGRIQWWSANYIS
jgi:hypothetical protein